MFLGTLIFILILLIMTLTTVRVREGFDNQYQSADVSPFVPLKCPTRPQYLNSVCRQEQSPTLSANASKLPAAFYPVHAKTPQDDNHTCGYPVRPSSVIPACSPEAVTLETRPESACDKLCRLRQRIV